MTADGTLSLEAGAKGIPFGTPMSNYSRFPRDQQLQHQGQQSHPHQQQQQHKVQHLKRGVDGMASPGHHMGASPSHGTPAHINTHQIISASEDETLPSGLNLRI